MRFRFDDETKDRTVRMYWERRQEAPDEPQRASLRHIGGLTGISAYTIRGWVNRARVDAGEKAGLTELDPMSWTAERVSLSAVVLMSMASA